jgi:thiamine biosynthesis lipoprotein
LDDPENAELPTMEELEQKAQHIDINNVIVDDDASTVYLNDPEMRLDVGAIAKGYATEMVSVYAMEHGFENGMISVGGNVRTIGSKLDGKDNDTTWSVGIQNPDSESEQTNLYILGLYDNYSLVTSGVYERYYTVDGKQYHHIIDPNTLMPSEYFLSVSIACNDSGMADALSTSVFNMSYEDGLQLIESLQDTEALWVFHDGSMKFSSGFEKFIKK